MIQEPKKPNNPNGDNLFGENIIGGIVRFVGYIVIIGGLILGLVIGSWGAIPSIIQSSVGGLLMVGMAEIINLLENINENTNKNRHY